MEDETYVRAEVWMIYYMAIVVDDKNIAVYPKLQNSK